MSTLYIVIGFVVAVAALMWAVSSRAKIKERADQAKKSAEISRKQAEAALDRPKNKAELEKVLQDGDF